MKSGFYSVLHAILVFPARLIFRMRVIGAENEPKAGEGPYLVCSNHQSVLDPVFICAATKRQQPHFMAKEELFRVPVLGRLVRWLGAYPVSRGRSDVGAVKRTVKLLESGTAVGMFPQGTRCAGKDPRECRIKAGVGLIAAHTGVQVLPVYIHMKNSTWKFFRRVTVVIGKPIPFASLGYNKEEAGEYARISGELFEAVCALGDGLK